ncbi:hypothetical protein [Peribacillus glennii]|uniref:Uncharacterized protein n=1 Tax=Peribacillus glennii TaxID=2303991 RepID=A0A372L8Y6_9BACI|nr:hypothetical protein [Peribacillus glennii]RFU61975.1 hypothetical protein D0466_15380 [Peribacillus glennii]
MDIEVFIGDLSDPDFDYETGSWSGNIPKRISGYFPNPHNIFPKLVDKIDKKEITGRQTDWGSWTAILYPNELTNVIIDLYGEQSFETDTMVSSLLTFVRQLDNTKQYGLVASEMS